MDVLFLDANVLFSAAYREGAGLQRLWEVMGVERVTSAYAVAEARRNLPDLHQRLRLDGLLSAVRVVDEAVLTPLPADTLLPEKDRPILAAALASGATYLLTGDARHFGAWYGKRIGGVLVLRPGEYLRARSA